MKKRRAEDEKEEEGSSRRFEGRRRGVAGYPEGVQLKRERKRPRLTTTTELFSRRETAFSEGVERSLEVDRDTRESRKEGGWRDPQCLQEKTRKNTSRLTTRKDAFSSHAHASKEKRKEIVLRLPGSDERAN